MSGPGEVGQVLASSATGTTFLVLIQLASRVFTFASNQVILRTLPPAVLGIAAQLELYQLSILYFSRESIRLAIQRQPLAECSPPSQPISAQRVNKAATPSTKRSDASQSVVNVSYLSIALGIPSCLAFTMLYRHFGSMEVSQAPFFYPSVLMTGVASLMELGVEPFFAVVQQRMLYERRAAVEMPAAFIKSLVICSAFIYAGQVHCDVGVLPFALGYLAYSLALICGYSLAMFKEAHEGQFSFLLSYVKTGYVGGGYICVCSVRGKPMLTIHRDPSKYYMRRFSRQLTSLAASVFFQSLVKHILTQGDSIMLAAMSNLEDQGIYAIASNYGGLIARIIFQPLEESSRNLFSTLLTSDDTGTRRVTHVRAAKAHLLDILYVYQLLSVVLFPLGPVMVPQLLRFLGGRQWMSPKVGDLLSLFCYYIPFLAFNGITEAFVSSAANTREIRKQTAWMGAFSACYAVAAYIFLEVGDLGAYGLVLANIVNMAVRTLWSYLFIKFYLRRNGDGLRLKEASIRPGCYIVAVTAVAISAQQRLSRPESGFIQATAFSGIYALLV
ncbi:hypothetical protein N7510_008664 [Penicillium lagena]|uniref:uncharacterized protein n=1 Tax=Penicillium lagena TaxID=94218 RepID=UPI00254164BA|nr:uncharacterized protein N7510_008664 [Penicillium lagena]KAJ5605883.1 hypothetical protein N7510_008664 [Penicillium lagena]